MKNRLLTLLALFVFSTGIVMAGEPVNPPKLTKTIPYKELKAQFGENLITNGIELQDNDLVTVVDQEQAATPPCGGMPCKRAIAQQTKLLQDEANACCCTIIAGVICCEGGLTVEYLIAVSPTNCN